jgi:hypothetical protein
MLSRPVLTSHTFLLCVYMIYTKAAGSCRCKFLGDGGHMSNSRQNTWARDTCVWHHCYLCGWRRRLPYSFELVTWWPPSAPAERDYGSPTKDNSRWQTKGFPILDCLTRCFFFVHFWLFGWWWWDVIRENSTEFCISHFPINFRESSCWSRLQQRCA